jgi:hypothetical protein
MMKTLICVFLSVMLFAGPAIAQDQLTPEGGQISAMQRGEKAPFDGILLSDDAVAKLRAKMDTAEKSCQIKLDHQIAIDKADLAYTTTVADSKLQLCQETAKARLSVRDDELKVLSERLEAAEKARANGQLIFGGGVVVGVGLTVLAGWAIGQAAH